LAKNGKNLEKPNQGPQIAPGLHRPATGCRKHQRISAKQLSSLMLRENMHK